MARVIIRQYYVLTFLVQGGVGSISAIYSTFLLGKGLNLLEINLVNLAFFTTLFLCEIPTGAFADVFGRKASFVTSCLLFTVSLVAYAFSETFWQFVLAEMIGAVARTFLTGAFDAWLVDKLKHSGYEGEYHSIFARGSQVSHGSGLLIALFGALLYDLAPFLPWLMGSMLMFSAGTLALFTMKEEYFARKPFSVCSGAQALKHTVSASVMYGAQNANVRFVILLAMSLSFAVMAPNMQWQPYFGLWSTTQTGLGFVWVGMMLCLIAGSKLAPRLLSLVTHERRALLWCQVGTAAGIIGTVLFGSLPPALLVFLLHEVTRGAFGPLSAAYLHSNIPSRQRATIVSFESIGKHLGGALGLIVSGVLAYYASMQLAWIVGGATLLGITLLLWRNGRK